MLPTFRQVATLVVAGLPLTAAASPRAAAPPPLLHAVPADTWTGATFDRVGGAALVGGLAMVAFLLVAGVVALVVAARMLLATTPSSSTSRWLDHGREQSAVELGGSGVGTAGLPTIPAPRRPLRSGARPPPDPHPVIAVRGGTSATGVADVPVSTCAPGGRGPPGGRQPASASQ